MSRLERVLLALLAPALLLLTLQTGRLGEGVPEPPEVSAEALLTGEVPADTAGWRVARVQGLARVLVVEFPSAAVLQAALGRAAAHAGAVPSDGTLLVRGGALLRFFDEAGRRGLALNEAERHLSTLVPSWPGALPDRARGASEAPALVVVGFARGAVAAAGSAQAPPASSASLPAEVPAGRVPAPAEAPKPDAERLRQALGRAQAMAGASETR